MSTADDLLATAAQHRDRFPGELPAPPSRKVAIVTCMDARIDPAAIFGLEPGDAHVIRNAGGAVTDDTIRSLTVSQRLLGTREVMLVHHTQCGMATFTDDEFRSTIERETGTRPPWSSEAFADLDSDVRQCVRRVRTSPFVPFRDAVRGFVYDLADGQVHEVV